MKLAIVIPGYQANAHDWCIPAFTNLAHELAKHAEVHVFALRYPPRRDHYAIGKLQVHAAGGGALAGRRIPVISLLNLWRQALSDVRAEHEVAPFSAVVGIWATESGWLATRAARLLGLPSLLHLAGGELTWLPAIGYGNQGVPLERVLVGASLRSASMVTAPSTPIEQAACRYLRGGSKVVGWSLGADTNLFSPAPRPDPERVFTFVSVGSLIPVKGYEILVDAFAMLHKAWPELKFRWQIVGSGPLRAELEQFIQHEDLMGYVSFAGEVAHEHLPDLLRRADCFVLGSRHEAQCMAALEAMACGLPWVAPPVGALVDCAADSRRSGLLVRRRSAAEYCGALLRMVDMPPEERAEWGANARAQVVQRYNLATQAAKLRALLRQLTGA